jgi:PIN domain nuclease of toxin-antitoxin system
LGKLEFKGGVRGFARFAAVDAIEITPIGLAHLDALKGLPWIHRDPFDRLLIATALSEQMTLITTDNNIKRYEVPQLW